MTGRRQQVRTSASWQSPGGAWDGVSGEEGPPLWPTSTGTQKANANPIEPVKQ